MVLYFTSNTTSPPSLIYMGKDKFENEELIKFSLPIDIWFHADKLSSAHVYLRMNESCSDWAALPHELLMDCAQLTKANSIEGNKKPNVKICFCLASNLKKDGSMDVGQVTFHKAHRDHVKKVSIEERDNAIVNRLNKTKRVVEDPDLYREKMDWEKEMRKRERLEAEEASKYAQDHIDVARKVKKMGGYEALMKEENMYSNRGLDLTRTVLELEEDFM